MNRLAFEFRRRTIVAFARRTIKPWRDRPSDHFLRGLIEGEERLRKEAGPHAVPIPDTAALGLKTDREWEDHQRSRRPPPRPDLAGFALFRGDYAIALEDMEGIDEWVAGRAVLPEAGAHRESLLSMESYFRRVRGEALAGLGRKAEAVQELDRAEACLCEADDIRRAKMDEPLDVFRLELAEAWEMADEPAREAGILDPPPGILDRLRMLQERAPAEGQEALPDLERTVSLQPATDEKPDPESVRVWAANLEAKVRSGAEPTDKDREMAHKALRATACHDPVVADRARALAYEILGDRKRALDGWQRYCLGLWAGGEPEDSPLWQRGWAHVERLGGKR